MTEVAQNDPVEPTPHDEESTEKQLELSVDSESELLAGSDETQSEDNAQAETQKPVGRREKRISQLTFEKYELERQKNAEIEDLQRKLQAQAVQAPVVQTDKPTLASFDYDEEKFSEALTDWKVEQKFKALTEGQAKQQQQQAEQQAVTAWNEKRSGYAAANPGYLELSNQRGAAVTSNAVASFITASENGPKLHHSLLENFDELQRIQSLPDVMIGAELAKLESKLTNVKPIQKSNAPKPVRPVGSSASSASTPARSASAMPTNW